MRAASTVRKFYRIRSCAIVWPLMFVLSSCGPVGSDSATEGTSSGGAFTGGSSAGGSTIGGASGAGGSVIGGAAANGGSLAGGAASDGGTSIGGSVSASGGSEVSGGADNAGGSGELPNWESNPPDAEFRACMDSSGHELVLLVKTVDGCTELKFTDDIPSCLPLRPGSGWCVSEVNWYLEPDLCNQPGLTDTRNPTDISTRVNDDDVMVIEEKRLDAIVAIDWIDAGRSGPPGISVSGCIANCEERDCREQ